MALARMFWARWIPYEAVEVNLKYLCRIVGALVAAGAASLLWSACSPRPVVLVFGDSLTLESVASISFQIGEGYDVRIGAFGGDALCDFESRILDESLSIRPRLTVIAFTGNSLTPCMTNAVGPGASPERITEKYRADLTRILDRLGRAEVPVLVVGGPPSVGPSASPAPTDPADPDTLSSAESPDTPAEAELDTPAETSPDLPMIPGVDPSLAVTTPGVGVDHLVTVNCRSAASSIFTWQVGQTPTDCTSVDEPLNRMYREVSATMRSRGHPVTFVDGGTYLRDPNRTPTADGWTGGWTKVMSCLPIEGSDRDCRSGLIHVRSSDLNHLCPSTYTVTSEGRPECTTWSSGSWRWGMVVSEALRALEQPPQGALDAALVNLDGSITVRGWGFDPDSGLDGSRVEIRRNGVAVDTVTATGFRPDVASRHPVMGGNHGFELTVPGVPGRHEICAVVLDESGPSRGADREVGCRVVIVAGERPAAPGGMVPMTPVRVLDTRLTGQCVGSAPLSVKVAGTAGVPLDVSAVALNVTVVEPQDSGFAVVWPRGTAQPVASNINYTPGSVVPNAVTVQVGSAGSVSVATSSGCPHVVVDLAGWYQAPEIGVATSAGGFQPVLPTRLLDTRSGGGCVNTSPRSVGIAGRGGIPADATAVVLNVTVVNPWGSGFATVWPSGEDPPASSNLNFGPGQIIANAVTVGLGSGGRIDLSTNNGCPHMVVDVAGWYRGGESSTVPGAFTAVRPTRLLDTAMTRTCVGSVPRRLSIAGVGPIPADARSVVLNVTVDAPTAPGFLTAWPTGANRPLASNLNYLWMQTVPNQVTVALGPDGAIQLYTNAGCPRAVVDVFGWYR